MRESSCKIVLDKGTKTVKGASFEIPELERTVIVHEDPANKNKTNITDIITGYKFTTLNNPVGKVKEQEVREALDKFLKHYGVKETLERLAILVPEERK